MTARSLSDTNRSVRTMSISYYIEHYLSWIGIACAIVMGVIGILVAFGQISTATSFGRAVTTPAAPFWNATLWLSTGIATAVLAAALHRTEHHFHRDPTEMDAGQRGLWMFEHWLAWLTALGAICLGALALVIGFDVFNEGYTVFDGLIWSFAAIGAAAITSTLHNVSHHQLAAEEDYIVGIVERRVGTGSPAVAPSPTRPYQAPER